MRISTISDIGNDLIISPRCPQTRSNISVRVSCFKTSRKHVYYYFKTENIIPRHKRFLKREIKFYTFSQRSLNSLNFSLTLFIYFYTNFNWHVVRCTRVIKLNQLMTFKLRASGYLKTPHEFWRHKKDLTLLFLLRFHILRYLQWKFLLWKFCSGF